MHSPCQRSVHTLRLSSQVWPCLSYRERHVSIAYGQEPCLIAHVDCTQVFPIASIAHVHNQASHGKCWRALPGLPEDDEAVQLARLAEASGNTLESVLQFQYKALSRKEADAGAAPDSDPYQDVRRWGTGPCCPRHKSPGQL